MTRKFSIAFIFILLVLPSILALGVSPGRTTLNYQPGVEKTTSLAILNSGHQSIDVTIEVRGELKDFILLSTNKLSFNSSEESKKITYKTLFPEGLSPGLHKADIVISEVPSIKGDGEVVSAVVSIISQVYIYVPCPGKCIESSLIVKSMEPESEGIFNVNVISRGKLDIESLRGIIDIYDLSNNKVGTINTNEVSLKSGASVDLFGEWSPNVNPGTYIARVNIFYDGKSDNFERKFGVGKPRLVIGNISVNKFALGQIAKLSISVENKWNEFLNNSFANLIIYNEEGQEMTNIQSVSENIPAFSRKELILYWDSKGVKEGKYNAKLVIHYAKSVSEKSLMLQVKEDNLRIKGLGNVINSNNNKDVNITFILMMLVFLLLVVNVAWLIFFKKNKKK